MLIHSDLEARTQEYGREIFARLHRAAPLPFSPTWFDERLMKWATADEAVKVQLFRLIDVLPMLRTPAEINRHLTEYFGEAGSHMSVWMRHLLRIWPQRGMLGKLLAHLARRNAERLARR